MILALVARLGHAKHRRSRRFSHARLDAPRSDRQRNLPLFLYCGRAAVAARCGRDPRRRSPPAPPARWISVKFLVVHRAPASMARRVSCAPSRQRRGLRHVALFFCTPPAPAPSIQNHSTYDPAFYPESPGLLRAPRRTDLCRRRVGRLPDLQSLSLAKGLRRRPQRLLWRRLRRTLSESVEQPDMTGRTSEPYGIDTIVFHPSCADHNAQIFPGLARRF